MDQREEINCPGSWYSSLCLVQKAYSGVFDFIFVFLNFRT